MCCTSERRSSDAGGVELKASLCISQQKCVFSL